MQIWKQILVVGMGSFAFACAKPAEGPAPAATVKASDAVLYRMVMDSAQIQVTVIKDAAVAVTGTFDNPSGLLSSQDGRWSGFVGAGTAKFATGNPARDRNIQMAFFQNDVTHDSGRASKVSLHWENVVFNPPAAEGVSAPVTFDATVEIGAAHVPVQIQAVVTRVGADLQIQSRRVALSLRDLGFETALAALIQLCGHKSIEDTLQVEFRGTFRPATLAPIPVSSPHP